MYSAVSTILLSSLLVTTHAFVPMNIQPLPSDLDTDVWVPIATLAPITPAPTPAPSPEVQILPVLDANFIPDLKPRQVSGQGPPAAAPQITQVPPVTTYYINSALAPGSFAQVPVVYTQTFARVPDQWEGPEVGTIGLGTITGKIGAAKQKRSLPTQAPLAADAVLGGGESKQNDHTEEDGRLEPLVEKLKKAAKGIQEELCALLIKGEAKPSAEAQDGGDSAALPKEQKTQGASNDARVIRAGPLAVIAVSIVTICAIYA